LKKFELLSRVCLCSLLCSHAVLWLWSVLVKIRIDGNSEDEWSVIELQGHVNTRDAALTLDSLPLGVLDIAPDNAKEFTLVVGSTALVGKVVRLEKPLAVLAPDDTVDDHTVAEDESTDEHWRIVGVVRNKLVFKTRPQPIVSKVPQRV
jgi:chromosome transmission fidelity protein 8